ncbi:MAG: BON domain-containing protein [Deltaproteobacteria bacterium]|nr:BON domain-containing protein [Deltaproteobacteria bacterium]
MRCLVFVPLVFPAAFLLLPAVAGADDARVVPAARSLLAWQVLTAGDSVKEAILATSVTLELLRQMPGDDDDGLRIMVSCVGTTAQLTGAVRDRAAEEQAMAVTLGVPGVRNVVSTLVVNPGLPVDQNLEAHRKDAVVATDVKLHVLQALGSSALDIRVQAEDGVITLSGQVEDTLTRDLVVYMVRARPAVQRVIDLLDTQP